MHASYHDSITRRLPRTSTTPSPSLRGVIAAVGNHKRRRRLRTAVVAVDDTGIGETRADIRHILVGSCTADLCRLADVRGWGDPDILADLISTHVFKLSRIGLARQLFWRVCRNIITNPSHWLARGWSLSPSALPLVRAVQPHPSEPVGCGTVTAAAQRMGAEIGGLLYGVRSDPSGSSKKSIPSNWPWSSLASSFLDILLHHHSTFSSEVEPST